VVLIDGSTSVWFSARPRFAPTISFCHIRLTGALIYIKPRRLDFSSFFLLCLSSTVRRLSNPRSHCPLASALSTAPSAVSLPPLLCSRCHCTTAATTLRRHSSCRRRRPQLHRRHRPYPRCRRSSRRHRRPQLRRHRSSRRRRTIHRSIRRLVPSLSPTCHGSRQKEGQGARG
jgi:hypothetical protein